MSTLEKICVVVIIIVGLATVIGGMLFFSKDWSSRLKRDTSNSVATEINQKEHTSASDKVENAGQEKVDPVVPPANAKGTDAKPPVTDSTQNPQVKFGSIKGTIMGRASNSPINGAMVDGNVIKQEEEVGSVRIYSKEDGTFELKNVPVGEGWWLTISKEGFATTTKEQLAVQADTATDVGIVYLEKGVGIEVFVTDTAGLPLGGAEVLVQKTIRVVGRTTGTRNIKSPYITDSRGRATITDLDNDIYYLTITKNGYATSGGHNVRIVGGKPDKQNYKVQLVKQ
ncbi:MAG: hypothetical protein A2W23_05330 [Planctomycetes bacterium RBG_16_43_13]|nr:MAG: hypothetical protein A2W23_05330 [Planctomycetes bacterium RBG_16_43_13]